MSHYKLFGDLLYQCTVQYEASVLVCIKSLPTPLAKLEHRLSKCLCLLLRFYPFCLKSAFSNAGGNNNFVIFYLTPFYLFSVFLSLCIIKGLFLFFFIIMFTVTQENWELADHKEIYFYMLDKLLCVYKLRSISDCPFKIEIWLDQPSGPVCIRIDVQELLTDITLHPPV